MDRHSVLKRRRERAARGPGGPSKLLALAAAVAIMIVVLPRFVADDGPQLRVAPAELHGRWSTTDPRYQGRAMTFGDEVLLIDSGEGPPASYPILSIGVDTAPVHREYVVTYEGSAGPEVLEVFVYDDETLRLRNPPEATWRRAPGG